MFDWVPLKVWLLLLAATLAFAPGQYVFRHLKHAPNRRDITRPPEDLSWRSSNRFSMSVLALAFLAVFCVFIFTPAAAQVGHSPRLWPVLMLSIGVWMLVTVARGFLTGKIEAMSRGSIGPFERASQPKRFWASMAWNGLWGCVMLWITIASYRDAEDRDLTTQCQDEGEKLSYQAHTAACTKLIAQGDQYSQQTLAWAYSVRGTAYYRHQDWNAAFDDLSRSIALDPKNAAYARYNRAFVYLYRYQLRPALDDLTSVIRAYPDDPAAYAQRAWVYEHLDDNAHAAEDRAKFKALVAEHPDIVKVRSSSQ